jgi:hypothetical protein
MKIIIGCEFSGVVRRTFREKGHDARSCDLLPTEDNSEYHIKDNLLNHLNEGWNLAIFHPPCTHLAVSGARWFKDKQQEQKDAIDFFMALVNAPIPKICVENPISIMSTLYRKPDQIIQPWWFGHGETKATCLWLKGLPKLEPTEIVEGRQPRVHYESPGKDRWKNRSRTLQGIANAMAEQWGGN